jgi:hypothetical protein
MALINAGLDRRDAVFGDPIWDAYRVDPRLMVEVPTQVILDPAPEQRWR